MYALTAKELSKMFNMSEQTVKQVCKTKGSPAFKKGIGKKSPWLCFPDKFEIFLKQLSEKYKG